MAVRGRRERQNQTKQQKPQKQDQQQEQQNYQKHQRQEHAKQQQERDRQGRPGQPGQPGRRNRPGEGEPHEDQPGTPVGQGRLETEAVLAGPAAPDRTWGHWLGRYGEQAAARYLAAAGYRLLDRNWVCRDPDLRGELDLVARYRRTVVACEVKTRSGDTLDNPAEAVTAQKAQRLRLLAVRWLAEQRTTGRGVGGGFGGAFGASFGGGAGTARGSGASHGHGQIPLSRSGDTDPTTGGPGLRIDVIAVRTDPHPPFALRSLDHLIGVA
jgi:putative endonuclease